MLTRLTRGWKGAGVKTLGKHAEVYSDPKLFYKEGANSSNWHNPNSTHKLDLT